MGIIESVATASTAISMQKASNDVGISMLKKSMEESEQTISKIMEMAVPSMPSGSSVDYSL